MARLDWVKEDIGGLKQQGLYNNIRTIGSAQGARLIAGPGSLIDPTKRTRDDVGVRNTTNLTVANREVEGGVRWFHSP